MRCLLFFTASFILFLLAGAQTGKSVALTLSSNVPKTSAGPKATTATKAQTYVDTLIGKMVLVEGGSFTMGCKDGRDTGCGSDEKPAHSVRMGDFFIAETEVTQGQWRAVMGSLPILGFPGCDDCPVEGVTWDDIQGFLQKLNARSGTASYRLPTESEWEFAARGGNYSRGYLHAGSNTPGDVAWYEDNSGAKTHPVKGKKANELGLYDMSGNVWEWCADCWHDDYNGHPTDGLAWTAGSCEKRVLRGGSWVNSNRNVRAAYRVRNYPDYGNYYSGFRLAGTAQ